MINTRIQNKHDIEANWLKAINFIPLQGEIIVYDIEIDKNDNILDLTGTNRTEPYTYERFKIGDGKTVVSNLPFSNEYLTDIIADLTERITELENQSVPAMVIDSIELPMSGWTGTSSPYSQVVEIPGVTERSQIDMQPTIEQIIELQERGIALMVTNDASTVTVYAINGKPASDYTMQITIMDAMPRAEGVSF